VNFSGAKLFEVDFGRAIGLGGKARGVDERHLELRADDLWWPLTLQPKRAHHQVATFPTRR
jgi:hypothetical protein